MRLKALIVLFVILISILTPMSLTLKPVSEGTFILTLDICNANAGGTFNTANSFYIPVTPFKLCNFCNISFKKIEKKCFRFFILSTALEHPPKI